MTKTLDKSATWKMFNQISGSYDFVNRILSMGIDMRWRKKVANYAPKPTDNRLLDLGTGTGDFILALIDKMGRKAFQSVVGIDLADDMLKHGQAKMDKRGLDDLVVLKNGDATQIPFLDNGFDMVTMAFAIRNVNNLAKTLKEIYRVMDNGGRAFILEFSIPKNPIIKHGYLFYFRYILPLLGGIFSGNLKAYSYLNKSVEQFPYGEDFCALMRASGYERVEAIPLSFGIATLYMGEKY